MAERKVRVVVAKPGLDGHDRGAKIVARALRDAGFEVIYTGLHQTPSRSSPPPSRRTPTPSGSRVLSGAHNYLFQRVLELLKEQGADDIAVFGGGIIPAGGHPGAEGHGREGALHPGHVDPGHHPLRPGATSARRSEPGMDFELTREQQAVRDVAREFAEAEVGAGHPPLRRGATSSPTRSWPSSARPGSWAPSCPRSTAAPALDYVSYALAVEELNRVDASVGITMWAHNSLCTNHIALFGSNDAEGRVPAAPRPRRGARRLGADRAGLGLRRRRHEDARRRATASSFVLNGSKAFITNAGVADVAVVMAVTDPDRRQQGHLGLHPRQGHARLQRGQALPEARAARLQHRRADLRQRARCPPTSLCGELRHGLRQHHAGAGGRAHRHGRHGASGIAQAALDQARQVHEAAHAPSAGRSPSSTACRA